MIFLRHNNKYKMLHSFLVCDFTNVFQGWTALEIEKVLKTFIEPVRKFKLKNRMLVYDFISVSSPFIGLGFESIIKDDDFIIQVLFEAYPGLIIDGYFIDSGNASKLLASWTKIGYEQFVNYISLNVFEAEQWCILNNKSIEFFLPDELIFSAQLLTQKLLNSIRSKSNGFKFPKLKNKLEVINEE